MVLTCAPWPGVVEKVHSNGRVDIALEGGGKAWGMSEDEIKDQPIKDEEAAEREKRATADKSWPPKTMEQKVPTQRGQK